MPGAPGGPVGPGGPMTDDPGFPGLPGEPGSPERPGEPCTLKKNKFFNIYVYNYCIIFNSFLTIDSICFISATKMLLYFIVT